MLIVTFIIRQGTRDPFCKPIPSCLSHAHPQRATSSSRTPWSRPSTCLVLHPVSTDSVCGPPGFSGRRARVLIGPPHACL